MPAALDWISKIFWWRTPPKEEPRDLEEIFAPWESCIISMQRILLWENPVISLVHFACINIVFWTIIYLECRLYGLLFFTLLIAAVFDWLRYHGLIVGACRAPPTPEPASSVKVLTLEELCGCLRVLHGRLQSMCSRAIAFREQQPAMFCLMTCGCCLLLTIIGKAVSGACIIYTLLISIFTMPALCVRYPEFWQIICSCATPAATIDEYLPDNSDDNMRILNLVEETACSPLLASPAAIEAQLYPDISSMPSCENSLDGFLDADANLPSPRQVDEDLSDTSEISEPIEIKFKSKHFNGDGSSTSSGEELSKGLRFRGKIEREASSDSSESFELVSKDDL